MDAAIGHPQDGEVSDDEINAKIILKWLVCGSIVVAFGLINVAFGIYLMARRIHPPKLPKPTTSPFDEKQKHIEVGRA